MWGIFAVDECLQEVVTDCASDVTILAVLEGGGVGLEVEVWGLAEVDVFGVKLR